MINGRITVVYGKSITLQITVNKNYAIKQLLLEGTSVSDYLVNTTMTIPGAKLLEVLHGDEDIVLLVDFAEDRWIEHAKSFNGEGIDQKPFVITTAEELAFVAYMVNIVKNAHYTNASYVLKNDIDLNGKFWTPIGVEDNPFNGKFSFDGYSIFSLTVEPSKQNEKVQYNGVFQYLGDDAKIIEKNTAPTVLITVASVVSSVALISVALIIFIRIRKKKQLEEYSNN